MKHFIQFKQGTLMKKIRFVFVALSLILVPTVFTNTLNANQAIINTNEAMMYDFNAIPMNQLTDKIGMRFFTTSQFTVIQWTLKQGAKLPSHTHMNEQITRVDSGELLVSSEGRSLHLIAGQMMVFPSHTPHGFIAQKDTVIYEQQTPIRQDFLEPDFIQKLSDYLSKNQ
ncbi:MAG: cupin domain-containing protein [Legionella sp.]|nr:cupin domain-containing protein [Legionella sp.]